MRGFLGAAQTTDRSGVYSSCLTCGKTIARGQSYCGAHRPIRDVRARQGGAVIARFRQQTLLLPGTRCEAVIDGERCKCDDPRQLEAHHIRPVSKGGSNVARENGVALCREHHAMITAHQLSGG